MEAPYDLVGRTCRPYSAGDARSIDRRLIRLDEGGFVLANDAGAPISQYRRIVKQLWRLAGRYWFDVLVLIGLGLGIAIAVVHQGHYGGPEGPLWLDVAGLLSSAPAGLVLR